MLRVDLYQDRSQWFTSRWWYWKPASAPESQGHGPFPFKWMAAAAGWLTTR